MNTIQRHIILKALNLQEHALRNKVIRSKAHESIIVWEINQILILKREIENENINILDNQKAV